MTRAQLGLWIAITLTSLQAASQEGGRTIEMKVDGLVCAFCAQGVTKKLASHASVEDVVVDLERGMVAVALREGKDIDDETLRANLAEAGYSLRQLDRTPEPLGELRARLGTSSR